MDTPSAEAASPMLTNLSILERYRYDRCNLICSSPTSGDHVLECQNWVQQALIPYLRRPELAEKSHWLNFIGGTKAMTLALISGYSWHGLDYKSSQRAELQVVTPKTQAAMHQGWLAEPNIPLRDASPLDVVRLHSEITQNSIPAPYQNQPQAETLAQAFWDALGIQDPALAGLFKGFSKIWAEGRGNPNWKCSQLNLSWLEFLGQAEPSQTQRRSGFVADGWNNWFLCGYNRLEYPRRQWFPGYK